MLLLCYLVQCALAKRVGSLCNPPQDKARNPKAKPPAPNPLLLGLSPSAHVLRVVSLGVLTWSLCVCKAHCTLASTQHWHIV